MDFLEECANRDSSILDWTESTRKKMGQVVFRMLAEMGYLKSTRSLKLQHVLIRPELRVMLEDNYKPRIKECMEASSKGYL
jgi:ribosomal protein S8